MSLILNIGRAPDNDIVFEEDYISSHHAQLILDDDGKWFINDLHSTNGTYVNGERITAPKELAENDHILLGGSLLNWNEIYQQYTPKTKGAGKYRSRLYHYLLGLAAAALLFFIFFMLNEFVFTGSAGKDHTNGDSTSANKTQEGKNDDQTKKAPRAITYDFSCVTYSDNSRLDKLARKADSLERSYIDKSNITVSLQEEIDFGNENHRQLLNGSNILENNDSRRLKDILQKLIAQISAPRGFSYQLFLIDSKEINAWTTGGRIYFTTAMLNFTKDDDEIAGIIGHEINHNELNHINHILKVQKLARQKFGDRNGEMVSTVNKILTAPFGKKDEVHCDLKGEDLVVKAGFDPCKVIGLWNRMSDMEGEHNSIDGFIRSHPYATVRVNCIKNHLKTNYNIDCHNN